MGDSNDQAGSKEDGGSSLSDLLFKRWRQGLKTVKGEGSRGTGKAHSGEEFLTLAHFLQDLCDSHRSRLARHSKSHLPPGPQS